MMLKSSLFSSARVIHNHHISLSKTCFALGVLRSVTINHSKQLDVIPSLVSPQEATILHRDASTNNVKFLDASWHLDKNRNGFDEFIHEHIPGAQFFDIDDASDKQSSLPHMVPTPDQFAKYVSNLGVTSDSHVLVYCSQNCFSAARAWWMFRLFGHDNVSILNGGLAGWKNANGVLETGVPVTIAKKGNFEAKLVPNHIVNWSNVLDVVNDGKAQIVDARSKERFFGEVPEPRPGLVSGAIPGSLSLPFNAVTLPNDVTSFKPVGELRSVFEDAGIIVGSRVIFTCGSGVTAAILSFAMHLVGVEANKLAVYDGSWSEWGSRSDLPKINVQKD